jgi:hypothetical protein
VSTSAVISGDFTSDTAAVGRRVVRIYNNANKIAILKVCPFFKTFKAIDVTAATDYDFSTNTTGLTVYLHKPSMVKYIT